MSRIRGVDTQPELTLRRELHRLGLRFRVHNSKLLGKPDIVLPKYKSIIFVHGCFWHRHKGCKVASTPKSNTDFWLQKFATNIARDKATQRKLRTSGWRVFVVWECKLSSPSKASKTALSLESRIRRESPRHR
jgi:DNA mismatch endonuclease, patch repair protein